jgi:hypothetical protein
VDYVLFVDEGERGGDTMKIKKDLMIVALATFCLTATLFMMTSTKSQAPSGTYDPLLDSNHDGSIDIYDAIQLANHYDTSGDPTLNVNVISMPQRQPWEPHALGFRSVSWTNYIGGSSWSITPGYGIWFGGYSRLFIFLSAYDVNPPFANVTIYVSGILWNITADTAAYETFNREESNITLYPGLGYLGSVMKVEIKAETIEYLTVMVESPNVPSGSVEVGLHMYLRNE